MNGIAAPIVAHELAPTPGFLAERQRISVVMVVYMTGAALQESVERVLSDPLVDEFVIVDNGSTGAEGALLRALAARDGRVVLVTGHGNVGFARGANMGARKASGDVLVFLNPDAFLQPRCIAELAREIEGRPSPCIVGGRVLNADLTEQRGARRGEITLMNALMSLSRLAGKNAAWRRDEVHWEAEAVPDQAVATLPLGSWVGGRGSDHLRRLLLHASRGLRCRERLRRELFPARGGRRPLLAGARNGRSRPVPPQGRGDPPGPYQPDQPPAG